MAGFFTLAPQLPGGGQQDGRKHQPQRVLGRTIIVNLPGSSGGVGGTSIAYTVRKNGAATAVTCTITTAGGAATCSDVTNSVAFAAGDLISIGTTRTGAVGATGTRWTAQYQ